MRLLLKALESSGLLEDSCENEVRHVSQYGTVREFAANSVLQNKRP